MFVRAVRSRTAVLLALMAPIALWAPAASAEVAWIKDELILKLRSLPGNDAFVLGTVKTGDSVRVMKRRGDWVQVRVEGPREGERDGWLRSGYLQSEAPAKVHLARGRSQAESLQTQVTELTRDVDELRTRNEELGDQAETIAHLEHENTQLRADRWPEWIAGACILSVGMVAGGLLARANRRKPRIRL